MIDLENAEAKVEAIIRKLIDSHGLLEMAIEAADLNEEERAYIGLHPHYEFYVFGSEDALQEYRDENGLDEVDDE